MSESLEHSIQNVPKEHREWFRERYQELRNQYSRYYLEQVALGRMTKEESIKKCGQAVLNALEMELSLRR